MKILIQGVHCETMASNLIVNVIGCNMTMSTTIVVAIHAGNLATNYSKILSYVYIPHASNPSNQ